MSHFCYFLTLKDTNQCYEKYNFCYHNITFLYPMLTKKLYFEGGGGASLSNFMKNKKIKNKNSRF